MKKRAGIFPGICAVLLFAVLAVQTAVPAAAQDGEIVSASALIAMQKQNMPSGDFLWKEPQTQVQVLNAQQSAQLYQAMSEYEAPADTLVINRSDYYYYYEQLEPLAKEMYDIMLEIAKDPVTEGNYGLLLTDQDPLSDEFLYAYWCASIAMTYDHPELFWLYNSSEADILPSTDVIQANGRYMVFFGMSSPYTNYTKEMTAFNQAADAFLADIDRTGSQYQIARQIHDKLLDLVTYNTPVMESGMDEYDNLAHTAYACLVADSDGNANYAVCDGYSLAYEYLLQQCGIPAVFIGGKAGFDPFDMGGHAWNMVSVDGAWYEADSTWDDAGTIEDNLDPADQLGYSQGMEALTNTAYRELLQHFLFMVSSETMSHYVPDEDTRWYIPSSGEWGVSFLGECWHERLGKYGVVELTDPQSGVISLAPDAGSGYNP